ncbi:MAG: M23 family metallopeptidase [Chloroflexi bacterium]|nr:M23 family metallopeptidase [Chloroflexota bacterium]MCY3695701.1 M23 family metallopeptidase [Chloroflexota bacterium]
MFVAAAAVAVIQATGSDDAPAQAALEADQAETMEQQAAEQSQSQPQAEAQPAAQTDEQQHAVEAPSDQAQAQAQDAQQQQATAQSESEADDPADDPLRGFIVPIADACISQHEGHLPGANRAYRNDGVHEGLDFYEWASCAVIDEFTPILAAKDGLVIRADLNYVDITPDDWARFEAANWAGEDILDELRGRQVYIDHGRGIVTRYAHLSAIAQGVAVGARVQQGQIIGFPGESGQREVYTDENDVHLHFEIRVGDGWLGQGQSPQQARQLYLHAFGLPDE